VSNTGVGVARPGIDPDDSEVPVEAMFQFLGAGVRVISASVEVLRRWTARYGAFRVPPVPADITVQVHVATDTLVPGQVTIERDGLREVWRGMGPVLPPLATPPLDRWTWLHGAAVTRSGHAVVLLGGRQSGTTLLALSAVALGAKLLGDGALPLDPTELLVAPFPEALRLRREDLAQLAIDPAHPALVPSRTPARAVEWEADPAGLLGQRVGRVAAEATTVVVLQPTSWMGEPRLEPLSPGPALRLAQRHLYQPGPDPGRARPTLSRLCHQTPVFALTPGRPDRTARLLDTLLA
jgi:hypothetical protein